MAKSDDKLYDQAQELIAKARSEAESETQDVPSDPPSEAPSSEPELSLPVVDLDTDPDIVDMPLSANESDDTEYLEFEGDTAEVIEPSQPVLANDPFPDQSDSDLERLRTVTREEIRKLNGHFGRTKQDLRDAADRSYELARQTVERTLTQNLTRFLDPMTVGYPPQSYFTACIWLLFESEHKPKLYAAIDSAQTMPPPFIEGAPTRPANQDRSPNSNEISYWHRDDLTVRTKELGALVNRVTHTLQWRLQMRKATVETSRLAELETQLGIGVGANGQ